MRYLVTGACGFLGSNLTEALLNRGDSVIGVDNLVTGSIDNIRILSTRDNPNFEFRKCEVWNIPVWDVDGIFHLASPAAPVDIQANPGATFSVNSRGTEYLLNYARSQSAKFLFVSTMKVFGECERVQPYISGKREGERLCTEAGAKVARLASVYGPRMRVDDSRVIPVFITRALRSEPLSLWNGGAQIDSFCYVSDIVRALIDFMDSDENGVVEFGNPVGISIIDLARFVLKLSASDSLIYRGEKVLVVEQCHNMPDLERAKNDLRWEPLVALPDGLKRTINYFRDEMRDELCRRETITTLGQSTDVQSVSRLI